MRVAAAGLAFTLVLGGCASAKPPAEPASPSPELTCTFKHPAKTVLSLKKLPEPIQKKLREISGRMADRGEFFNAGDVVTRPAPFNRYIIGGEIGEKWFVFYEHGGFAYWKHVVLFGSDPSGTPRVLFNDRATDPDLCAMTDKLVDTH